MPFNNQLWSSRGQSSRSQEDKVRFGGLAEPSFSTPLGREYEGREYEENNTELA